MSLGTIRLFVFIAGFGEEVWTDKDYWGVTGIFVPYIGAILGAVV